jgi:hypothetical protein
MILALLMMSIVFLLIIAGEAVRIVALSRKIKELQENVEFLARRDRFREGLNEMLKITEKEEARR